MDIFSFYTIYIYKGFKKLDNDIIIIDNFFEDQQYLEKFKETIDNFPTDGLWVDVYHKEMYTNHIVEKAGNYFNMKKIKGYEAWTHINSKPSADYEGGWHYDKDEYRYNLNNILSFPVCSCVFYLQVENLIGGRLIVEDIKITPRTNRLIIFGPRKKHYVEDFKGTRISININPWNRLLEEYT